jgi:hypothetical protein
MGEMADFYNEEQEDSLIDIDLYQSGQISKLEAIDRGILDQDGSFFLGTPNPEPQDFDSLTKELDQLTTIFNLLQRK